jgi:hypothetical protein
MRVRGILAASLLVLCTPTPLWAIEPVGNWRIKLWQNSDFQDVWLLRIETKDKQYAGKLLSAVDENLARVSQLEELSVAGDRLRFTIRVPGKVFRFDCGLADKPGGQGPVKIHGSADDGEERILTELEQTKLDSLDRYTISKEFMDRGGTGPKLFDAVMTLLNKAGEKKMTREQVTALAEKAFAAADRFGPAWKRYVALNLSQTLAGQKDLASVGVWYARQAEKLLDATEKGEERRRVLTALIDALENAGLAKEAKSVQAEYDRLFTAMNFVKKFAGRKDAKSNQVVLVELFTGAQCPPCVGPDLAFDGLLKSYQPSEVVLLQHHLHIPRPDALASADTEIRANEYKVVAAPTVVFNGKAADAAGGGSDQAETFYRQYREVIDPLLEMKSPVRLTLSAQRTGNQVAVAAGAFPVEGAKLPESSSLRVVLVEDLVNYKGGNGINTHHHVVRGLLNGDKGWSLKAMKDGFKQSLVVDLDVLRKELKKYLDEYGKANAFPNDQRPLELANLRVVAFVQDDATRAILQTIEAPVTDGGKK